jgi:hypothetical protein
VIVALTPYSNPKASDMPTFKLTSEIMDFKILNPKPETDDQNPKPKKGFKVQMNGEIGIGILNFKSRVCLESGNKDFNGLEIPAFR